MPESAEPRTVVLLGLAVFALALWIAVVALGLGLWTLARWVAGVVR